MFGRWFEFGYAGGFTSQEAAARFARDDCDSNASSDDARKHDGARHLAAPEMIEGNDFGEDDEDFFGSTVVARSAQAPDNNDVLALELPMRRKRHDDTSKTKRRPATGRTREIRATVPCAALGTALGVVPVPLVTSSSTSSSPQGHFSERFGAASCTMWSASEAAFVGVIFGGIRKQRRRRRQNPTATANAAALAGDYASPAAAPAAEAPFQVLSDLNVLSLDDFSRGGVGALHHRRVTFPQQQQQQPHARYGATLTAVPSAGIALLLGGAEQPSLRFGMSPPTFHGTGIASDAWLLLLSSASSSSRSTFEWRRCTVLDSEPVPVVFGQCVFLRSFDEINTSCYEFLSFGGFTEVPTADAGSNLEEHSFVSGELRVVTVSVPHSDVRGWECIAQSRVLCSSPPPSLSSSAAPGPSPRGGHSMARISENLVVVFGGFGVLDDAATATSTAPQQHDDAELNLCLDDDDGDSAVASSSSSSSRRTSPPRTHAQQQQNSVRGSRTTNSPTDVLGYLCDCHAFDLSSKTWRRIDLAPSIPRAFHSTVVLPITNHVVQLFVVGGETENRIPVNSVCRVEINASSASSFRMHQQASVVGLGGLSLGSRHGSMLAALALPHLMSKSAALGESVGTTTVVVAGGDSFHGGGWGGGGSGEMDDSQLTLLQQVSLVGDRDGGDEENETAAAPAAAPAAAAAAPTMRLLCARWLVGAGLQQQQQQQQN